MRVLASLNKVRATLLIAKHKVEFDSVYFACFDYQDRVKHKKDKSLENAPVIFDINVGKQVNDFINATITQANVTRTNYIMWTMGENFQYQYAESWFKKMDK
ncbi:hypothetical protein BC332_10837 [Capsicum chinense]|nr:hypothetical protein BC332_10837 [Capsicum chinense]